METTVNFEFIFFPRNLDNIEEYIAEDVNEINVKRIILPTENYNIVRFLKNTYKLKHLSVSILDNDRVIVATEDYKKLSTIPEIKIKNRELLEAIKKELIIYASMSYFNLFFELDALPKPTNPKTKEKSKIRQKRKNLAKLKLIVMDDFLNLR